MYITRTQRLYDDLPPEYKALCREALAACKRSGDCRPDEWEHIVDFYHDEYTAPPAGWFCWWE